MRQNLLLTSLMLAAAAASAPAAFAENYTDGQGVIYSYDTAAKTATVAEQYYAQCTGDIVIPESITVEGVDYTVTAIAGDAFYYKDITSVVVPASVTSVGNFAFSECSALAYVQFLGTTPPTLGEWVFWNTSTSIYVPDGCTDAYETAEGWSGITVKEGEPVSISNKYEDENYITFTLNFDNNTASLTDGIYAGYYTDGDYTIPSKITVDGVDYAVTGIGTYAFSKNTYITTITIPAGIERIGYGAFSYCTALTSVTCLTATPLAIGADAFGSSYDSTSETWASFVSNVDLYVPEGSVDAYRAADVWKEFKSISAYGSSSITGITADTAATVDYYTIDGIHVATAAQGEVPALPAGLYITRTGNTTAKVAIR